MVNNFEKFQVMFWYGGKFKRTGVGLDYVGGEYRSLSLDPDCISWFDLDDLVVTSLGVNYEHQLYYLLQNCNTFEEGLRRVNSDESVMEMAKIGAKMKVVKVFVVRDVDDDELCVEISKYLSHKQLGKSDGERGKLPTRRAEKVDKKVKKKVQESYPTPLAIEYPSPLVSSEVDGIEVDVSDCDDSEDETYVATEVELSEDESLVLSEEANDVVVNKVSTNQEGEDPLSEYEDSEGEISNNNQFDVNTDFRNFKWSVGLSFASANAFRDALIKYALIEGRNVKINKSDKSRQQRLGVVCLPGCPFRVYASWDKRSAAFVVKTVVLRHTCQRSMDGNRQLRSAWVADQMLDVFKARPHVPSSEIIDLVRTNYRVIISKDFAYNIKYNAHRRLHGSMREHYNKVMDYYEALRASNGDSHFSVVSLQDTNPPTFQRFFVLFAGLKDGWIKGCRKVLCIDGCFIKTFLGGMLLSAIGRDPNEQMFPLAWAVVEGENNDSWQWFLNELKKGLRLTTGDGLTIISDEHQSILRAVSIEFPEAEHRHCARHIYANWKKDFKGEELKLLFWRCAKAYNNADMCDALKEMEELNPLALQHLRKCDVNVFCRSNFKVDTKCDVIVSNMAETFNNYVMRARSKHLIDMLEDIRTMLMKRLVTKREEAQKWFGIICPKVQELIDKEKEEASKCSVMPATTTLFQVAYYMDTLQVDIEKRSCTCKKWDLKGIPCRHGIAALYYMRKDVESYVDDCYSKDAYLNSYSGVIPPLPGDRH